MSGVTTSSLSLAWSRARRGREEERHGWNKGKERKEPAVYLFSHQPHGKEREDWFLRLVWKKRSVEEIKRRMDSRSVSFFFHFLFFFSLARAREEEEKGKGKKDH